MSSRVNGRRKGHSAERRLVHLFSSWWGSEFFRTPGSGSFATRGFIRTDGVDLSGDVVTTDPTFPFCIESKKVEGWTLDRFVHSPKTGELQSWWKQARKEAESCSRVPLLVFARNRIPEYVALPVAYATVITGSRIFLCIDDHKDQEEVVFICPLSSLLKVEKSLLIRK